MEVCGKQNTCQQYQPELPINIVVNNQNLDYVAYLIRLLKNIKKMARLPGITS